MKTFKPMLAVNAVMDALRYPLLASPKLDGIRCTVVEGRAVTRTLKDIPNMHISHMLSSEIFDGLDGELIVGEATSKTVYRDTVSAVMSHAGNPEVTFWVFDNYKVPGAYRDRFTDIITKHPGGTYDQLHVRLLPQMVVASEKDLQAMEEHYLELGYEGLILRDPGAPYKFGRSTVNEGYLLKMKRFEDGEFEIVGIEEEMFNGNEAVINELGRTKRSSAKAGKVGKGTMGALVARDLKTGVTFNVGTGFTAADRAKPWKIGSVHKYKFFPVGVKDAPRHPVYVGPRDPIDL